jgi:acetyl esterase/lipase
MKIQKIIIPAILIFLLASCTKNDPVNPDTTVQQTLLNQSYGIDNAQRMDIYLPAGRSTASTKIIIMIHGGGWTTGDKADFTAFVDTLKRRLSDYAIFNINYRLSANPLNIFPTQENDVKSAVEFIYSKASEYKISNKYVLMGASAGAHLAMLQGYKYNTPVMAKAVVSFFGPSDLTDMYNNPVGGNPIASAILASAIGATPTQNAAIYTSSSPVNFISSSSAMPTILLHGGADPLVSPSQSVAVQTKLFTVGIANQYVFYPTGGHGDWNAATYTDAFDKIQVFLAAHVQ